MPDLFNTPEPPPPPKKKYYKGSKGKFTNKDTARIYEIEKNVTNIKLTTISTSDKPKDWFRKLIKKNNVLKNFRHK